MKEKIICEKCNTSRWKTKCSKEGKFECRNCGNIRIINTPIGFKNPITNEIITEKVGG